MTWCRRVAVACVLVLSVLGFPARAAIESSESKASCEKPIRREAVSRTAVAAALYSKGPPKIGSAAVGELCLIATVSPSAVEGGQLDDRAVAYVSASDAILLWTGNAMLIEDEVGLLDRLNRHTESGLLFAGTLANSRAREALGKAVNQWRAAAGPNADLSQIWVPPTGRRGFVTVWVERTAMAGTDGINVRVSIDDHRWLIASQPIHALYDMIKQCSRPITTRLGSVCSMGLKQTDLNRELSTWRTLRLTS